MPRVRVVEYSAVGLCLNGLGARDDQHGTEDAQSRCGAVTQRIHGGYTTVTWRLHGGYMDVGLCLNGLGARDDEHGTEDAQSRCGAVT